MALTHHRLDPQLLTSSESEPQGANNRVFQQNRPLAPIQVITLINAYALKQTFHRGL